MGATTIGPVLSRRQLLVAAGMAGLAGMIRALPSPVPFPFHVGRGPGGAGPQGGNDMTLARFTPHLGTRFTARPAALAAVALTLEEAVATDPHPADPAGLRGEAFSLVFRAAGGPPLPDGIHRLDHPALGTSRLFLSAFGAGRRGQGYQVVVDRRVPNR
jgi:hypothetical protein